MFVFKDKKKIKFNKYVYLYFIPNNKYYIEKQLLNKLWYSNEDIDYFKYSSINEIKELIKRHSSMTIKDARYLLYENTKIIYNPNFFD